MENSKKFCMLLIITLSLSISAQVRTIEGIVTDENGKPIKDVLVTFKGSSQTTVTDNMGYYKLESVPDTIYSLQFSHADKEPASASIGLYNKIDVTMVKLGSQEIGELSLEDLLNMTVTTASKAEEKQSDAPGIISVMTKDELKRFGGTSLKDVLERIPGLISSSVPYSNRTTMIIRGDYIKQNSSHILILINGRPVREVQEGGVSSEILNTFPVDIIERIEVIKGPGSVLYGSDAFSGVINIITEKANKNKISLSGLYQDGGGYHTYGNAFLKTGDLQVEVAGNYFEKPEWKPEYRASSFISIPDSPYYFLLDTTYINNIPDKGGAGYLGMNYKGLHVMASFNNWSTLGTQILNDVTNRKLFGNIGYSQSISDKWNMDFNFTYTHAELHGELLSERFCDNMVGEWTNFITLSDKSKISIGGLYNYIGGKENILQNPDSVYAISKGDQSAFALYAQIDYQLLKNLKAIAGIQANKVGDLSLAALPRGGLIWYPVERINVKALFSQAYRAPSINELYMNFPSGLFGDKNLKPELVSTFDFSIVYQGENMQLGASFFYSKQKNIIQPVFYNPGGFERRYTNLGEVTFIGGEFESKYYINRSIYLNASVLYQTNKEDTVKNLAPIANLGFKAGISYMWDKGITISLFDIYQGDLDDKYIGQLNPYQGAYNLLHFHSEYNINSLFSLGEIPSVSILFNINNLLDQKVYMFDWGGFSNDAIPVNRGREIYIGLKITLE